MNMVGYLIYAFEAGQHGGYLHAAYVAMNNMINPFYSPLRSCKYVQRMPVGR